MSIFDELIAKIPEDDRKILDNHPELLATAKKLEEGGQAYSAWYASNWDTAHDMTKGEWQARQEAEQLRQEVEAAQRAAGAGAGMDSDDLAQAKTELQKLVEEKVKEVTANVDRTLVGRDRFWNSVYSRGFQHRDEFGQPLNPNELLEYMGKNQIFDPDAAYERMVAGQRSEISATRQKELEAKHQVELEEARKSGADSVRQEFAMGNTGMLPTDNVGGIVGVTHIAPSGTIPKEILDHTAGMDLKDPRLAQIGLDALRKGLIPVQ